MEYVVETRELKKRYGKVFALNGLTMQVEKGSIHALVGPNGSGKTTLIRILMGVANPSEGNFSLFGSIEEREIVKQRRRIGTLIETPQFYGDRTGYENLDIIRRIRGIEKKECITEVLSVVGLSEVGNRKVGKYSLGMRQRLGLAKALLGDPELLILDEPINGMDPQGVSDIRELLLKLKDRGHTIMLASHILKELTVVATHYSMIRKGKIYDSFTAEELSKRCGEWVEIRTPDVAKAKDILRGTFECFETEGDVIKLYGDINSGEVVKKLVLGGCEVQAAGTKANELESYFIRMMEE